MRKCCKKCCKNLAEFPNVGGGPEAPALLLPPGTPMLTHLSQHPLLQRQSMSYMSYLLPGEPRGGGSWPPSAPQCPVALPPPKLKSNSNGAKETVALVTIAGCLS